MFLFFWQWHGEFWLSNKLSEWSCPHFIAVGDFNGDGKSDLAVENYNSNDVSIPVGITPLTVSISNVSVAEGNAGTTNAVFTVDFSYG